MAPPIRTRPSFPQSQSLPSAFYPSPSEDRQNENHIHRKLTNLITWTIALSKPVKLWAMPCRATQDWWVTVVIALTKCVPLEKGMTHHLSIPALRTPWIVWKSEKIGHWKMNSTGQYMPNMLLEISGERKMKRWSQSKINTQLWLWLVMKINSNHVKSNIAYEPGI